jgi:RNA polymerase sigma factor (sigma-70 family)
MIEARVNAEARGRATRAKPDWDQESHETNRLVMEAVRALPERQRAAVVLRYYDDLSESQIAEVLDCSVGTVKSQLSKARSKLEVTLGHTMSGGMS